MWGVIQCTRNVLYGDPDKGYIGIWTRFIGSAMR
jgi:hypothetical protein